ncbi:Zinc finger protein 555 [Eumeta japonica]|uniref:Zinc finger protein 555 n=1 Tax=Eumeta variegata TaxID=151549 RepID=A0A4C1WF32_EUMVA|nr:Zinc finger protein 555 [Eumeta japonica]
MSRNTKRARKSKLIPRCDTSDMELIMAETEDDHNMADIVITNVKSEANSTKEEHVPKLSIKVEVEPCEEDDWHIPTKEEMCIATYLKDTTPFETKKVEVEYESDPEMQLILDEEAEELSKIVSDPINMEIMEKLFHNKDDEKEKTSTSKAVLAASEDSLKELDFESRINVSLIKKETTEAYEDILKRIADSNEKYLYKCSLCHLTWLSNEDFNAHIGDKHSNSDAWKIETTKNSLNRFIISLVRNPLTLSNNCPNCNELFSERKFLKRHMDETFKKCTKCMKLFHGCRQFHLHMPRCVSNSNNCPCNPGMDKSQKSDYKNCVCGRSDKFKKCIVCEAFFMGDDKLLEHQNKYHVVSSKLKMNVSVNKCKACKMSYVGKKDLHECTKRDKRVKCAMCKKEFHTQLLLNVHVKAMTKPNIKCNKCNVPYHLECEKYDHVCVIKKVLSLLYRCDICKRTFIEKEDVHRHIQLEHLIHFSSVPNFMSLPLSPPCRSSAATTSATDRLNRSPRHGASGEGWARCLHTNLNEKRKEIKNIHKEQNIVVTFSDNPKLSKRGTISNITQKEKVPIPLSVADDQNLTINDDVKIKTENLDSDQNSASSSVGETIAVVAKKQEYNEKSDLIKVFQGTSTYSKSKITNQLSSLVKNDRTTDESMMRNDENDVEIIIEQNECIDVESDEEKLVIDELGPVPHKRAVPENTSRRFAGVKVENNIEAEFEVNLMESESLSVLFQDLPEMEEEEVKSKSKNKKLRLLRCSNCGFRSSRKLYKNHVNNCSKQQKSQVKPCISKTPSFLNSLSSMHTCLLCQKDFTNLSWYYDHFVHHGYEAEQCPYCKKVQDHKTFLMHCLAHIKSNFYKCIAIDQEKKERTIRTTKCIQCKRDVEQTDYLTHFEIHHIKYMPESEFEVENDKGYEKPQLKEVPVHLFREVIKTLTEVKMYDRILVSKNCIICNKKSDRNTEMKRHLIEHLHMDAMLARSTNNELACQICSKKFQSSDQFKCHMREHALLPVYECQLCNKTFSDSSNFAKHKKVHDIKCLQCELCSRKFNSQRMYKQHVELHKTLKAITCPHCDKVFHFESSFKKHYKLVHLKPTFRCKYCKVRHPCLKALWDHLWEVHKVRKVQADCKECGASFRKMQALKMHIMSYHTFPSRKKSNATNKKNVMALASEK